MYPAATGVSQHLVWVDVKRLVPANSWQLWQLQMPRLLAGEKPSCQALPLAAASDSFCWSPWRRGRVVHCGLLKHRATAPQQAAAHPSLWAGCPPAPRRFVGHQATLHPAVLTAVQLLLGDGVQSRQALEGLQAGTDISTCCCWRKERRRCSIAWRAASASRSSRYASWTRRWASSYS